MAVLRSCASFEYGSYWRRMRIASATTACNAALETLSAVGSDKQPAIRTVAAVYVSEQISANLCRYDGP